MKNRYRMFQRGSVFYAHDSVTAKQESLRTRDRKEAVRILQAKNETHRQPMLHMQLARAYWLASDCNALVRTWQDVMNSASETKDGETKVRWLRAVKDKSFNLIRDLPLVDTRAERLLSVLSIGTVSTNIYLRRIHNFAVDMNWLPCALISKRCWPKVRHAEKRAITSEEHHRIVDRETNLERKAFYQLC
jgi:hypothetical protein